MRLSTAVYAIAALCCAATLPACAASVPSVSSADVAEVIAQQIHTRLAMTVDVACEDLPELAATDTELTCTINDPDTDETYDADVVVSLDSTGSLVVDFRVHDR